MSLPRDPSRASRREGMVSLRNPQQAHETIRFQDAALRGGCAYRISQGSSTGGEALGGSRAAILQVMSPQLAMCAPAERGAASRAVYREGERQEHNELTLQEAADRLDVSKIAVLRQIRRSVIPARQACEGVPWAPWVVSVDALDHARGVQADLEQGPVYTLAAWPKKRDHLTPRWFRAQGRASPSLDVGRRAPDAEHRPAIHTVSGCKAAHRNPTATVTTGPGLCSASRRKRRHNRCCALSASAITRGGCPLRRWASVRLTPGRCR